MKRRVFLLVALLVLLAIAIFAPPLIQINSFRRRITDNIGTAIGRPVSADSVQFQLLPRPAIVLANFVVAEDPAFGIEPMLQAPTVTAQIRLRSLWLGQLRVARISLEDPSLNLTHGVDGRWSLQNLLITAARATNNAENHDGAEQFPYIEASGARVNLKQGTEKTPFSLEDVDLAWSRDSARRWRVRLKGRPVRTDIEVGDTGTLRVEGTFLTASSLDDVQVDLNATWDQLQMGQLTKLMRRMDAGWRGDVGLQASSHGAIRELSISTRAQIFGLRRMEFVPATSLDPVVTCDAKFAHAAAALHELSCILPVAADGSRVEAHGTLSLAAPIAQSDVTVDLDKIPAASLLETARHVRQNLVQDLSADGEADGSFRWDGKLWRGEATLPQLSLLASGSKTPIVVDAVRVAVGNAPPVALQAKKLSVRVIKQRSAPLPTVANTWQLDPVQIDMGAAAPLAISATATRSGYAVHWKGSAAWSRLMLLADLSPGLRSAVRLSDFAPTATSTIISDADLDFTLRAPWFVDTGQSAQVLGTLHARNLRVASPLLPQPVEIPVATAQFAIDHTQWSGVARYAGTRIEGGVILPAHCPPETACVSHFAVRTQQLDLAAAIAAERSQSSDPVLAFLERLRPSSAGGAAWPSMTGSVHIGTLTAGTLVIRDADALLDIGRHTVNVETMSGRTMGGTLNLDGQADAEGRTSKYRMHFKLSQMDSAKAGVLFHESWNLGTGDVEATLTSNGNSPSDLAQNATGDFRLDLLGGALRSATASLLYDRCSAAGRVGDRKLTLRSGTWLRDGSNLVVGGTVGFDRGLQLRIEDGSDATVVSGTISAPVIGKP